MTPMPVNPIIVVQVDPMTGVVIDNRNNIGNDLRIVVTESKEAFDREALGVPYAGPIENNLN